ncbi:MAG: hypothetical protein Kow0080_06990 [Candidatus Promineifilaceae bacterium]
MKPGFEWRTDEEAEWDVPELVDETAVSQPRKRPYWAAALVIAVIFAGGIGLVREASRRIADVTASVTADLVSSHNLLVKADTASDEALFLSLLSGRDLQWTAVQEQLFAQDMLVNRAAFGLTLLEEGGPIDPAQLPDTAVSLEINPDFTEAVLAVPYTYVVRGQNGLTETVVLTQTAVYRRGVQRWLYAPPAGDFWGNWQTTDGEFVSVTYPQRDAETAEKLAVDLDTAVAEACANLPLLNCPAAFHMTLRLGTDPVLLLDTANLNVLLTKPGQLELPAPTLMGLPANEASYQNLLKLYVRPTLAVAITDIVGYTCCIRAPVYGALLQYQLAQLGWESWPVTADDYRRLLLSGYGMRELLTAWSQPTFDYLQGPNGWLVFTAVDFLATHEPKQSAAAMQRQIMLHDTLTAWLAALRGGGIDDVQGIVAEMERDWLDYAYAQAQKEPPPIALPDQNLLALCSQSAVPGKSSLYRYQLNNQNWQKITDVPFAFVNALPNDGGLIIQTLDIGRDNNKNQTLWWHDGVLLPLLPEMAMSLSFGQADPSGRYVVVYVQMAENGRSAPQPYVVDLADCTKDGCAAEPTDGLPVWSPDGRHAILVRNQSLANQTLFAVQNRVFAFSDLMPEQADLLLADRALHPIFNAPVLETGYAPFWVNVQQFGFLQYGDTPDKQELVLASVYGDATEVVLSNKDLLAAVPQAERPSTLKLRYAFANPADPNMLVLTAFDVDEEDAYLFTYNRRYKNLTHHLTIGYDLDHAVDISPNGRFLIITGSVPHLRPNGPNAFRNVTYLLDLESGKIQTIPATEPTFLPAASTNWSLDGDWLITNVNDRVFGLSVPAYDYQQIIRHDLGDCSAVMWTE